MSWTKWILIGTAIAAAGAGVLGRHYEEEDEEWRSRNPLPDRPDNPPPWVQDPTLWDHAREAVRPDWDRYDDPWAVVAHVYEKMGGRRGG